MTASLSAPAYVNHGRWVVDCPFCGGAEQEWPQGLRTHPSVPHPFGLVNDTLHCGYTGKTCVAQFPDDRFAIESVLSKRPEPQTRNWFVHESVEDLHAENVERGI